MLARVQSGYRIRGDILDVRLFRADSDAGGEVRRFDFNQLRDNFLAGLNRVRTSRVNPASYRWIDWRGYVALKHDALPRCFDLGIGDWDRGNQSLRIRHQRFMIDGLGPGYFHEFPEIHDCNAI